MQQRLGWLLLRRCELPQPDSAYEFLSPLNRTTPDHEHQPAPHVTACDLDHALGHLSSVGIARALQGRRRREASNWETEIDFWAWSLGGKEAVYSPASEALKQRLRHDIDQMHHLHAQHGAIIRMATVGTGQSKEFLGLPEWSNPVNRLRKG